MAHLELLYYFVAITILFVVFLHRSITDIHGRCPCYSVPFRCYHIFVCCFCIGASRIFTDIVRVSPCHSVAIIIILFVVFCIGVSRIFTDVVRVSPCHSVAIIILFIVFASEHHGYSRTLSVLVRAIPLLSLFCLLFLHRSITDIHGRCPC